MHDIQLIRTSSITDYKLSITIIVGVGELQRLKKKSRLHVKRNV